MRTRYPVQQMLDPVMGKRLFTSGSASNWLAIEMGKVPISANLSKEGEREGIGLRW